MSATRQWTIRHGLTPLLAGGLLVLSLLVLRILFDADEQQTRFLGQAFGSECAFRVRFGIPCPNCGLTRAVILALHGGLLRAWSVSPAGPVLVVATLVCAALLTTLGVVRMRASQAVVTRLERLAPRVMCSCAAALLLVWLVGWIAAVARALSTR